MTIKRIKRILGSATLFFIMAAMISCSGNGKDNNTDSIADSPNTMQDSTIMGENTVAQEEAFSKEVVEYLTGVYTKLSSEGVFSPEFEELQNAADKANMKEGNEMGYFDYDVLTQSQDPGELKGVEIVSIEGDIAKAKVKGGFGNGTLYVTVVKIDGKLYIDDVNGDKEKAKAKNI